MSNVGELKGQGMYARARCLADHTPEQRNRYVDFLRAASITVVVVGHWLMAAAHVVDGELKLSHILQLAPWSQWLTWVFQVMPLFFIVGGYSNAASWGASSRAGIGTGNWLSNRLHRLVGPMVALVIAWTAIAVAAHQLGVDPQMIKYGSKVAFVPVWFLAVYLIVVILTPMTHWAWRRFGMASFWVPALCAAGVDVIGFAGGFSLLRWVNYGFVWVAVHQLGYLWRDGYLSTPARTLPWAAGGLAVLVLLVTTGSYPISMISVPGEEISNSRPPTLALLALAALHLGLLLTMEAPVRRWLQRPHAWTVTILVNARIMTLYLWHMTAMVLVIGLANLLGGIGLGVQPGRLPWWLSRPVWIVTLGAVLACFLAIFGRLEGAAKTNAGPSLPLWQVVVGTLMVCSGLALLALGGIGAKGLLGIRIEVVLLTLAGAALVLRGDLFDRARA